MDQFEAFAFDKRKNVVHAFRIGTFATSRRSISMSCRQEPMSKSRSAIALEAFLYCGKLTGAGHEQFDMNESNSSCRLSALLCIPGSPAIH